jgi:hypothetical protein
MCTALRPSLSACTWPCPVTRTQGMPANRGNTHRQVGAMVGGLMWFGTVS